MCNVFDFGVENWNYGVKSNFVERNTLTNNCKSFIMNFVNLILLVYLIRLVIVKICAFRICGVIER